MAGRKTYLGYHVLTGARARISAIFENFPKVYVSFSGGKDSTVMFHLCAEEARRIGRKFGVLFIDWECQYRLTMTTSGRCWRSTATWRNPTGAASP